MGDVMRIILAALYVCAFVPAAAWADVLLLDDGTQVSGQVTRETRDGQAGFVVRGDDGGGQFVPASRVRRHVVGRDSVDDTPDQPAGNTAMARLESLRRATANLADAAAAVERYERFIAMTDDEAAAEAARTDLTVWQRRLDGAQVRYGGEWLTVADRDARAAADFATIDAARQALVRREGDAMSLAQALALDPATGVSGAYLLGVIALDAGQLAAARQQFERVRASLPNHAPSLVNLAHVQVALGRPERATWFLAEAVTAAPDRRDVLDNAHELLNLVGGTDDRNAVRLRDAFAAPEAAMREQMRGEGLHRFGSDWVDDAFMAEVQAEYRRARERADEMRPEAERLESQLRVVESEVRTNEAALRRLEAQSVVRDAEGRIVRLALPPEHGRLRAENDRLSREASTLRNQAAGVRFRMQAVFQNVPQVQWRRSLIPVGADGVPVVRP